jgi:hypothetical protein
LWLGAIRFQRTKCSLLHESFEIGAATTPE